MTPKRCIIWLAIIAMVLAYYTSAVAAGITIDMVGVKHWGTSQLLTLTNTDDWTPTTILSLQPNSGSSGTRRDVLSQDITALTGTDRFNGIGTLCYGGSDPDNIVAEIVNIIVNSITIRVFQTTKSISCPLRIIPAPVSTTAFEPIPEEYTPQTYATVGSTTVDTPLVLDPNTFAPANPTQGSFAATWKSSPNGLTSGILTITAKNLPSNTGINASITGSLTDISAPPGITTAIIASSIQSMFNLIWSLSSTAQYISCTNGGAFYNSQAGYFGAISSRLVLITGSTAETSCDIPISKQPWVYLVSSYYATAYNTDATAVISMEFLDYGELAPVNIGKLPDIDFVAAVMVPPTFAISSISSKKVGKFEINKITGETDMFQGKVGTLVSTKISKDYKWPSFEDYMFTIAGGDDNQHQQHLELDDSTASVLDTVEMVKYLHTQNDDQEQSQQFAPQQSYTLDGMSVAAKQVKVNSIPFSAGFPDKGPVAVASFASIDFPTTDPKPTLVEYSWGGVKRELSIHPSVTTTRPGSDTTTGSDFASKYISQSNSLEFSFRVWPKANTIFKIDPAVGVPVNARFLFTSPYDFRTVASGTTKAIQYTCTTSTSTLTIEHESKGQLRWDRFLLKGTLLPTEDGALITCTSPIDLSLVPSNVANSYRVAFSFTSVGVYSASGFLIAVNAQTVIEGNIFRGTDIESVTQLQTDADAHNDSEKFTTEASKYVITIVGAPIKSQTDFDRVIADGLASINANIPTASAPITKDDLAFITPTLTFRGGLTWDTNGVGLQRVVGTASKTNGLWSNGSFLQFGLKSGYGIGGAADEATWRASFVRPRFGFATDDNKSKTVFTYITQASATIIADYQVAYLGGEPSQPASAFTTQASTATPISSSGQKIVRGATGGSSRGSYCLSNSQCADPRGATAVNTWVTLSNTQAYCYQNKCVDYFDLPSGVQVEAAQVNGDMNLASLQINPFNLGESPSVAGDGSSAVGSSLYAAILVTLTLCVLVLV